MRRSGFTAVEIMVVMTIMIALMAMSVGAFNFYQRKSKVDATKFLLQQIVLGMNAYGVDRWSTSATAVPMTQTMWDLNNDVNAYLDASGDSGLPAGYTGFVKMAGINVSQRFLKNKDEIYDAWGRRIRVVQRAALPATERFGVKSDGEDGIAGNTDDLTSY